MQRGHRTSITPMDYEWTNQTGPVDPQSPFLVNSQQSAKKREHSYGGFQFGRKNDEWKLNEDDAGPHSVLDSPSKSGFATPNRLREPNNQRFFFAQDGNKPLPVPQHVQNDVWTPRTPASTYDFSSGGETPNTPAVDSDAATPDTSLAAKMGRMGANGDTGSPKKAGRRESWYKRLMSTSSPSPTKPQSQSQSQSQSQPHSSQTHYSHKAEHRIQKKRSDRSRSKKRADVLRDLGDDSDNELVLSKKGGGAIPQDQANEQQTYAMSIAGFLHWVEAHPNLPSVLSFYMQLTVNIFLATGFMYILWCAWQGVMSDVDIASSKHMSEVMVDMALCAKEYRVNRCDDRVPQLEKVCGAWETCMNRDPKKVARASVTAKTFAAIFNSFVEEFSYKSMVFTAIIIFGGFNLSNWAFGLIRTQQQQQQQQSHNPNEFIPQTPHRVPSNSYIDQNQINYQQNWQQTPYHTPYGGMRHIEAPPLQHTQSMPSVPLASQEPVAMIEDRKTPRKRGLFR